MFSFYDPTVASIVHHLSPTQYYWKGGLLKGSREQASRVFLVTKGDVGASQLSFFMI